MLAAGDEASSLYDGVMESTIYYSQMTAVHSPYIHRDPQRAENLLRIVRF